MYLLFGIRIIFRLELTALQSRQHLFLTRPFGLEQQLGVGECFAGILTKIPDLL